MKTSLARRPKARTGNARRAGFSVAIAALVLQVQQESNGRLPIWSLAAAILILVLVFALLYLSLVYNSLLHSVEMNEPVREESDEIIKWSPRPSSDILVPEEPVIASAVGGLPIEAERQHTGEKSMKAGVDELAYCVGCREERPVLNARYITLGDNGKAVSGRCPTCGTKVFKVLGFPGNAIVEVSP